MPVQGEIYQNYIFLQGRWVKQLTSYVVKTSDYTLTISDVIIYCMGSHTQTLPNSTEVNGKIYTIKNIGNGVIILDTTSLQTINESVISITINSGESYEIQAYDGNWQII